MSDADFYLVEERICMPLAHQVPIDPNGPDGGFNSLTPEERMFLAIWHLEVQVDNGGFFQFYINTGGWLASEAKRGYEEIGLPEHASIVQCAIDIARQEAAAGSSGLALPDDVRATPASAFEVYQNMQQASRLPTLDDPWYALNRRVDPLIAKTRFVRARIDCFPHVLRDTDHPPEHTRP